jgi:hypothetical protein
MLDAWLTRSRRRAFLRCWAGQVDKIHRAGAN